MSTGYFSVADRGTVGHLDISDGKERAFAIRGEPGDVRVRDERTDPARPHPRETLRFKSVQAALLWCAEDLMPLAPPEAK